MSEETKKIHSAMIAVMRDITSIGKSSKNVQQGFNFRGIDAVYNELHNLLAKHGIVTLPRAGTPITEERTTKSGSVLRFVQVPMTYTFIAEDGSSVCCEVIGEGMDSGDKATNKAMAIAHKYALLQTFLIPTEEQKDPDHETHEVAPRNSVAKVMDRASEPPRKAANPTATWRGVLPTNVKIAAESKPDSARKWVLYGVEFSDNGTTVEAFTFDEKIYSSAKKYGMDGTVVNAGVAPNKKDPSKWELVTIAPSENS